MKRLISLLALVLLSGCIIGTWPTPEAQDEKAPGPSGYEAAEELCDGVDNDGDGVVDEGCACSPGAERGCIGIVDGQCGLGVQHCRVGLWGGCNSVGPPYSAPQQPAVTILGVNPTSLDRGGTEVVTVTATAEGACVGIRASRVEATLASSEPVVVRVRVAAHDDGIAPDPIAGDGEYTAQLVNAFGPGVPAQALTLRVGAALAGAEVTDEVAVMLEEAP